MTCPSGLEAIGCTAGAGEKDTSYESWKEAESKISGVLHKLTYSDFRVTVTLLCVCVTRTLVAEREGGWVPVVAAALILSVLSRDVSFAV